MKTLLLICLIGIALVLPPMVLAASPPDVDWIRQFGTSESDRGDDVAVDVSGRVYITGWTDYISEWTAPGDAFLSKYDTDGNLDWTDRFGTPSNEWGTGVAVDEQGNTYVTGATHGILAQGPNPGGYDVFLRKYGTNGNVDWTQQLGSMNFRGDVGNAVAVDTVGNIYIVGETDGNLPGHTNPSVGTNDAFLIKYDSEGNLDWTHQLGTPEHEWCWGVAVDGSGNIYISGETGGSLPGNTNFGGQDVFIAKYDAEGNPLWDNPLQFGTSGWDSGQGVAVDVLGNIYITGGTEGSLGEGGNYGSIDAFLAKCDADGGLDWICQIGTESRDSGYAVAVDVEDIYVTGYTDGNLGGLNAGGWDAFLCGFDTDGNFLWDNPLQFGTSGSDAGYGVAVDGLGGIYIGGSTEGSFPGNINLGGSDAFLGKVTKPAVCLYALAGDLNHDCRVDFFDFARMAENWLIDCDLTPSDPACVPR